MKKYINLNKNKKLIKINFLGLDGQILNFI